MELEQVPWQIQFVRFFAPLAAVFGLIIVFATNIRISLVNFFIRFYTEHIVVVGLGNKSWQFMRTCKNKSKVVVVEREPENILIGRARELGVRVVVGDIFKDGIFALINLKGASNLIAFTGNDGVNVEFAIKARDYVRDKVGVQRRVRIQIHLNEIGLAHQLDTYPKFFSDYPSTDISFFSVYDLSARRLLKEYPPEIFADVAGHEQVHLAIYGFRRLALKLVIQAALLCQYANSSRLRFTIFDEDAKNKEERLHSEYPYISKICDFEFIEQSSFGPHVFAGDVGERLPSITQHIICRDNDEENLNIALMLRTALLDRKFSNAPILVRMQQSSGLAQLLESNTGDPEIPDGLYPFGMLDQVLHADNILTDNLDELARSIHAGYLESQADEDPRRHLAAQDWNELPQWDRKQNLTKADHLEIRLRSIRYRMTGQRLLTPVLSEREATVLTLMDHNRWLNERINDGWQYGKERLEEAKINPHLVQWDELSTAQVDKQIRETMAEPTHFAKNTGHYYQPIFVIGVSGHRLHKVDVDNEKLIIQIVDVLEGLRDRYPEHHFLILSPLAEGADRLVAKLAMEVLNASLEVPLPLPYDLYVSDFESNDSVEEFKVMVGQAEYYYEMPMRFGNVRELAYVDDTHGNESRNKQYALAGAYVIQRCNLLLAIYDGAHEAGAGGTGQIVRWYNESGIPPEFLYPSNYYLGPEQQASIILEPNP